MQLLSELMTESLHNVNSFNLSLCSLMKFFEPAFMLDSQKVLNKYFSKSGHISQIRLVNFYRVAPHRVISFSHLICQY